MNAKGKRLEAEYPFTLRMCFKNRSQAELFVAGWLDGGLEQMANASTEILDCKKQTWSWTQPALYVELQDEPENQ